jgi:hypothetical protein
MLEDFQLMTSVWRLLAVDVEISVNSVEADKHEPRGENFYFSFVALRLL